MEVTGLKLSVTGKILAKIILDSLSVYANVCNAVFTNSVGQETCCLPYIKKCKEDFMISMSIASKKLVNKIVPYFIFMLNYHSHCG